ncbi:S8 family serine peptidase [Streptomyces abyssomicinicus]|uniref:S8 family serine peptidase n=1 Tax=Streptomyces abyssomicinicus TaxID=574929 RepID=UPI00124F9F0B|nr:S8 family serine peptidase [Streptomyces abyssomicinicus]
MVRISRPGRPTARSRSLGRRWSAATATLGALAALSAGPTPQAAAADWQSKQWYLDAMRAEEMWKTSTGEGVKVAVIDSGVNPATASLKGQVLTDEIPAPQNYGATEDYDSHGTSMAEIIAGTGAGGGLKGLAPDAEIIPIRIGLSTLKDKAEAAKAPSVLEAIRAAADSDAKIISMSFGWGTPTWQEDEAVAYAHSKGKLLFAGVGNDAMGKGFEAETIGYPAAYPYVVGVAAADESGTVGDFSEAGQYVDVAAPGLEVPSWCDASFRSYCMQEGTSAATAVASASAALIWSAHPDWTANQVMSALIDTAGRDWPKDVPSKYLGYGLLRPRLVLDDADYKPAAPDADPLHRENAKGKAPSPSPSPSEGKKDGAAPAHAPGGEDATSAADTADDGNGLLWPVVGGAAAVLVIGGVAVVLLRKRRTG